MKRLFGLFNRAHDTLKIEAEKDRPEKEKTKEFIEIYKTGLDRVIFQGKYAERRDVIISQTNEESLLLSRGVLLAELHLPNINDPSHHSEKPVGRSIVGKIDDDHIDAYDIHLDGIPTELKHRIMQRMLYGEDHIVRWKKLIEFEDVIALLRYAPKFSYHFNRQSESEWSGKEIYYGFDYSNSTELGINKIKRNVGHKEVPISLHQINL